MPPRGDLIAPNVAPSPGHDDGNSWLGNPGTNSLYLVGSIDAAGRPRPHITERGRSTLR